MAVTVLSPWPSSTATVSLEAARACLREELGDLSDSKLDRLGSTAAALVEKFAEDAPDAIKGEAVIRTAGWLVQQPRASIRSERQGDIETGFAPSAMSALRNSGSMALLSPWATRRAAVVG